MSSAASGSGLNAAAMRFWYRHTPQLFLSELLEKRWMEPVIPFTLMCLVFFSSLLLIPSYASLAQQQTLMRDFAEHGLVTMAMAVTILSGGIDLSVGSIFALACFLSIYLHLILGVTFPVVIVAVLLLGALIGAVNGGTVRLRRNPALFDNHRHPHHRPIRLRQTDNGVCSRARPGRRKRITAGCGISLVRAPSSACRPTCFSSLLSAWRSTSI